MTGRDVNTALDRLEALEDTHSRDLMGYADTVRAELQRLQEQWAATCIMGDRWHERAEAAEARVRELQETGCARSQNCSEDSEP